MESIIASTSHGSNINTDIIRCMPNGTTRKAATCWKWSTSRARWIGGNGCNYEIIWTCITTNFCPTKNCKTSSFHLITSDTSDYMIYCYNGGRGSNSFHVQKRVGHNVAESMKDNSCQCMQTSYHPKG
jgi:hypothetical protein